tara:strand:+ start:23 stop:316 length:294 start_codon:yes stop_codon:yes gene_type:complete
MKKFSLITSWVLTICLITLISTWLQVLSPLLKITPDVQGTLIQVVNFAGFIISILLAIYARTESAYKTLCDIVISINGIYLLNIIVLNIILITNYGA